MIDSKDTTFASDTSNGLVLVDFYANWCGPCKMMMPIVDSYKDKIKVVRVNVDECEETAQKYGVMSIPTFMLMEDGKVLKQQIGAMPEQLFAEFIKK